MVLKRTQFYPVTFPPAAAQALLDVQIQQESQIRDKSSHRKIPHHPDRGRIDSTAVSLISQSRIEKTVTDKNCSGAQFGQHGFFHHLRPRGHIKQGLTLTVHARIGLVQKNGPDLLADGHSSRLAHQTRRDTARRKIFKKQAGLRALAATFGTLESNKFTLVSRHSLTPPAPQFRNNIPHHQDKCKSNPQPQPRMHIFFFDPKLTAQMQSHNNCKQPDKNLMFLAAP